MTNGINIELVNLTKSFGEKQVLKDINLTIPAGQFVAIVGKSGCGKSTLLRIIANLEQKTAGESLKDGIQQEDFSGVRVMFQEDRLLPWLSVLENVGVGTELKKDWQPLALKSLEHVGLKDRAKEWPHVLSGGQKQRVALARALSAQPRLLLLDEPLGALDALTRLEMQNLIEQLWLNQKYTSLLVTHDVAEAIALADRIILIEDGIVALDLPVKLPRPRTRSNPQFAELEEILLQHLLGQQTKTETSNKQKELQAII
ncbi:Aliphatic sulfonates import ATP-binding protein SsuB [Solibacillus isronensis B3W22]|uniref:Aliphatic sulfonates import ATP-binding protein SsuB n=1 Tax=Solibacillus isronensis B3W22 TaxID=1224748 RepID=K1KW47_9BACL|nr:ATP-binding cassette domain-containing protein [Solibacillus isronensis]AMO86349.1 aliphatic sulfonate ABC transporter ATP-binding protein [Solibacillus silvestris]EKB44122.1 Aliphatic sulfonates import ATP-binding protein SsuB [Solibacillus isronensis B3W22]